MIKGPPHEYMEPTLVNGATDFFQIWYHQKLRFCHQFIHTDNPCVEFYEDYDGWVM